MRNRSLTSTQNCGTISISEVWDREPPLSDLKFTSQADYRTLTTKIGESAISDVVSLRPEVYVSPTTGTWKRFRYRNISRPSGDFGITTVDDLKPSKPCLHTTTKVRYLPNLVVAEYADRGFRTEMRTANHHDGATVILDNSSFTPDPADKAWSTSSGAYTSDAFRTHDWFALMSQFDEACDQFIPSSFLAGEDIAQSDIFIDAIKAVVNPTRAIKVLIDLGLMFRKKVSRMNLGQASRFLAKNAANSDLYYNFGIKPAINDIRSALSAHQKVERRMRYLAGNSGRFVPVRVRKALSCGITNVPLDSSSSSVNTHFQWQCLSKESVAVIGAWGRVREDLNFGESWSAYLQYFGINKIVGLAWELIPFSFVVDWFTNAQERINYYTRLRTGGPFTEISRLWASERKEIVEELYCIPGYHPSRTRHIVSPSDPFVVCKRHITDYSRFTKIPDVSGVVDLSTLGSFHILRTGSLIVQRLSK